jgi:hypothetical protein
VTRRLTPIVIFLAVVLHIGTHASRAGAQSASATFDEAERLATTTEIARARDLYREASRTDPDLKRRHLAAIRGASLDWHVFQDAAAARAALAAVPDSSTEAAAAWNERARLETDLAGDFSAAREAAFRALAAARTNEDRAQARLRAAAAAIAQARVGRNTGKCSTDRVVIRGAIADLRAAIELGGPLVEPMQLLIEAGILGADGAAALDGWRLYYAERPALVARAGDILTRALPLWIDDALPAATRTEIGLALADSRMFSAADAVLRDPCATLPLPIDSGIRDVTAYAAFLRRLGTIADQGYRDTAQGNKQGRAFEGAVRAEHKALWEALSWKERRPDYSWDKAMGELDRRFGTIVALGEVDNTPSLLFGHRVVDETRDVEQYGHKAPLHFVQIDGMVSSGYAAWLTHDAQGTGGWIGETAMYQLRPMYIDGPVLDWLRIADPERRAKNDSDIAVETARDAERATTGPVQYFRGLDLRLRQRRSLALHESLMASGLTGEGLRSAFIARMTQDTIETSIWAHEGRHSIDQKIFKIRNGAELEFRAKLSEIAFSSPSRMTSSILSPVGGSSAHGAANKRVLEGLVAWMGTHAAEIPGLDKSSPLLPQLDKLSAQQLLAAVRGMDPILK